MMKNKKANLIAILAFIASVATSVIINQPAHAEMASIPQKWIFAQYYNCYTAENELTKEIDRDNHKNSNEKLSNSIFSGLSGNTENFHHLPSEGYFTRVPVQSINCRQVLSGVDNKISGILEAAGARYDATWQNLSETDKVLEKLGYKSENAETVVEFKIVAQEVLRTTTQTLFATNESDNSANPFDRGSATIQGIKKDGHITWKVTQSNLFNEVKVKIDNSNKLTVTLDNPGLLASLGGSLCSSDSQGDHTFDPIQLTDDIAQTKTNITNTIGGYIENVVCTSTSVAGDTPIATTTTSRHTYTFSSDTEKLVDQGNGTKFTTDGSKETALQSLIALGHSFSTLKLSEDEMYSLYSYYLDKAVPGGIKGDRTKCQNDENNEDLKNGLQEIHLMDGGKWYKYYINMSNVDTETKKYYDLKPGAVIEPISLGEIIEWFNSHAAEDLPDNSCTPPETSDGETGTTVIDPEVNEVDCWNAAGALGWILCPVIDFAHHTITAIYDSIVQNFLEFRAEFLEIRGDNAVYTAWQTFQSFANIGFVIVLLIVIFSQLTGVGIDNLGIKRILPKLIIAAILINLSYLICMLFVDISNILGVGLNNLFSNIVVVVDGQTAAGNTGAAVLSSVMTLAVGGAVGALAVVGVGITGSVIVLPLVLGLIGVLIGVLFFFILLGLRQALIIMLIVVSPIAVVCYMLPNTKSVFNKWLKLFEALLLLFPICGLVMGGSAFASDILMTMDTGFLGKLIAMLVGVVPFFFIPTLLKGSMAAAGNIGAKISGLGQSFSRGARGRVANSQMAKDYQTRVAAGIDRYGNKTALGKWRSNIASDKSRLSKIPGLKNMAARAQLRGLSNYEKMRDELDFASRPELITSEAMARRFSRQQAAEDAKLVNSGDVNRTGDFKDSELTSANVLRDEKENKGTLTYDFMQAVDSDNEAAQYAIIERMLANGHHGAQSYRNVLKALEQDGNIKALETAARAGKNSRHVGDLKGGARSVFDYINGVTNGDVLEKDENGNLTGKINAGYTLDDYVGKTKFANMSEAQLFNTDNEELSRWLTYANQKRSAIDAAIAEKQQEVGGRELTAGETAEAIKSQFSPGEKGEKEMEQYNALISQAQKAYNNVRLRGQAKESRQQLVADIAGIPESQRASQSIDVRGGNAGNDSGEASSNSAQNTNSAQGANTQSASRGSSSTSGSRITNSNSNSSTIDIDHSSTPQVTGEQLKQMAQQYSNQAGPTGRGNVSDEDLERNIARLQSKQKPTLQESEMFNTLYNEQGVRANIREANQGNKNNSQANNQENRPNPNRQFNRGSQNEQDTPV